MIILVAAGGVTCMVFWTQGDKYKLNAKLIGLVVSLLLVLVCIAFVSISSMMNIGGELKEIAEEDILLTEIIAKITAHQL